MKLTAIVIVSAVLTAQTESRGIVPEEVWKARPEPKSARPATKPHYQRIAAQPATRPPASARQVGITIWRLRSPAPGDSGARILVQQDSATVEWVPERV